MTYLPTATLRLPALLILLGALLLASCRPIALPLTVPLALAVTSTATTPAPTIRADTATPPPTHTPRIVTRTARPTVTPMPTLTATEGPPPWQDMPVIPEGLSDAMQNVYTRGQEIGNNPRAFAKVGDCGVEATYFLMDYDREQPYHPLPESYFELRPVLDYFAGSFGRQSVAGRNGASSAGLLTTRWADPAQCQRGESALACEYRITRPAFALIMLGTNDAGQPEKFAANLRTIVEYTLEQGIVPVLSTKADNLEGDHEINEAIASVAHEYELPVWNYWAAVQPLPGRGLQPDGAHLTFAPSRFDDPIAMKTAWPWRNLTALQLLDVLMQSVTKGGTP